eukprot:c9659_g1_i3.p1 GENE.c9659_g1_i3~~c9659_g1_i3.p1  ORF type:complete len:686 (+),score=212.05 c9659_g1_i3:98-2059(+)
MLDAAELSRDTQQSLEGFKLLRQRFDTIKEQRDSLAGKVEMLNAQSISLNNENIELRKQLALLRGRTASSSVTEEYEGLSEAKLKELVSASADSPESRMAAMIVDLQKRISLQKTSVTSDVEIRQLRFQLEKAQQDLREVTTVKRDEQLLRELQVARERIRELELLLAKQTSQVQIEMVEGDFSRSGQKSTTSATQSSSSSSSVKVTSSTTTTTVLRTIEPRVVNMNPKTEREVEETVDGLLTNAVQAISQVTPLPNIPGLENHIEKVQANVYKVCGQQINVTYKDKNVFVRVGGGFIEFSSWCTKNQDKLLRYIQGDRQEGEFLQPLKTKSQSLSYSSKPTDERQMSDPEAALEGFAALVVRRDSVSSSGSTPAAEGTPRKLSEEKKRIMERHKEELSRISNALESEKIRQQQKIQAQILKKKEMQLSAKEAAAASAPAPSTQSVSVHVASSSSSTQQNVEVDQLRRALDDTSAAYKALKQEFKQQKTELEALRRKAVAEEQVQTLPTNVVVQANTHMQTLLNSTATLRTTMSDQVWTIMDMLYDAINNVDRFYQVWGELKECLQQCGDNTAKANREALAMAQLLAGGSTSTTTTVDTGDETVVTQVMSIPVRRIVTTTVTSSSSSQPPQTTTEVHQPAPEVRSRKFTFNRK